MLTDFDTVIEYDENCIRDFLEVDCSEYVTFNDTKITEPILKTINHNISNLLNNLNSDDKLIIHKYITIYKNKLHTLKNKALIPCYFFIYHLYKKDIMLTPIAIKFIFKNVSIKTNYIDTNLKKMCDFENIPFKYDITIQKQINGWHYILNDEDISLKELTIRIIDIYLFCLKNTNETVMHNSLIKNLEYYLYIYLTFEDTKKEIRDFLYEVKLVNNPKLIKSITIIKKNYFKL